MLCLIPYEIRKVFQRATTGGILLLLLMCSLFLIWNAGTEDTGAGYTAQDVAQVYADHQDEFPEEFLTWIDNWLETMSELSSEDALTENLSVLEPLYTESVYTQRNLLTSIRSEVERVVNYDSYLEQIEAQALQMSSSTLFAQPNTFSYRNILSIPAAYEGLKGLSVPCSDSSGVLAATDSSATMFCLFCAVFLVVLNLVVPERQDRLFALIRPNSRGRWETMGAKLIALALLTLAILVVFYGGSLALGAQMFGLGDLSRPIQSLNGYLSCPYRITVGQYLIVAFAAKYLALLAMGILFLALSVLFRQMVAACLVECCLMLGEMTLYTNIDLHSVLSPLKQVNLFSLLDTPAFFRDYRNMNCFSFPVSILWVGVGTALVAILLGGVLCLFLWERDQPALSGVSLSAFGRKKIHIRGISVSLFHHESRKLWMTNRGAVILLILLVVQWYSYRNLSVYMDQTEYYYQVYSEQLAGECSSEKDTFVLEERELYDQMEETMDDLLQQAQDGEISEASAQYQISQLSDQQVGELGFSRAEEQYWRVRSYDSTYVRYVSTTGYDALLDNTQADVLDTGKLLLAVILGLSALFSMEYSNSTNLLIQTTVRGWNSVVRHKLLSAALYATAVRLATFLPRMLAVAVNYDLADLQASAVSLTQFSNAPAMVSILGWLIILQILKLAAALCATGIVLLLSAKTRNQVVTLLLSLVLLLLPVVTVVLGVTGEWGLLPFLTGHFWLAG